MRQLIFTSGLALILTTLYFFPTKLKKGVIKKVSQVEHANLPGVIPINYNNNKNTHSFATDTDNDGLSDAFEKIGGHDDYPELTSLSVNHADLVVFIRWRPDPNIAATPALRRTAVEKWVTKGIDFFKNLQVSNPDGRKGINLIPVYAGELDEGDTRGGANLVVDHYFPRKWKGIAHWHEFYAGSAGQSPILATNGSSGSEGGWHNFVHELGHQLGLSHAGFADDRTHPRNPLYPSLMNYNYSFSLYNNPLAVNFSYGKFLSTPLDENNITEYFPGSPIDRFDFLKYGPYNYKLKYETNPPATYIDWNRDGIFEKGKYRCDVNKLGWMNPEQTFDQDLQTRVTIGNVAAVSGYSSLYLLYATDPTLTIPGAQQIINLQSHPAHLSIWKKGGSNTLQLTDKNVTGDISAVINNSRLYVCFPTSSGVNLYDYYISEIDNAISTNSQPTPLHAQLIQQGEHMKSQLVIIKDAVYLFTWCDKKTGDPNSNKIFYQEFTVQGVLTPKITLTEKSQTDIGVCWDIENEKLCLVRTIQKNYPNRLQLVRYNYNRITRTFSAPVSSLIGSPNDETRTITRPAVRCLKLNPDKPISVYAFYKGDGNASIYCSRQVGDLTFHNGWEEVSIEGNNAMSIPSVAIYNKDLVVACRSAEWDDRKTAEENLKSKVRVMYNGTGIEKHILMDFNDVEYMRNTGLKASLEKSR